MTLFGSRPDRQTAGLVVVGGGPAGHCAAASYRKHGGQGQVVIISADGEAPYERPPLSKAFLRGETSEDALPMESPEYYQDNGIELWLADSVVGIDLAARVLSTSANRAVAFGTCVLATGSRPATLPVPGGDHPEVLRLRFLQQARMLRRAANQAGSAVIIGSGFIGCEAAASLAARGLDVTVLSVEELPQIGRLGRAVAERIAGWLGAAGVRLVGDARVTDIYDGRIVHTTDGEFEADLILTAAGIEPRSELAEQAGLAVEEGRIVVDERMATSAAGVYAAGDVALADNPTAGRRLRVEHWGEALRMGEVAGANAAGADERWTDVPGFWSEIGDHTVKYAAWGDGFDRDDLVDHGDGGFTVWYSRAGRAVGVLTHRADGDYERGQELIASGATLTAPPGEGRH